MKHILPAIFIFVAILAGHLTADAVSAYPGVLTVKDSSGYPLRVKLRGDEFLSYYLTEDDHYLYAVDGDFYYATVGKQGGVASSRIKAKNAEDRSASDRAFLRSVDRGHIAEIYKIRAEYKPSPFPAATDVFKRRTFSKGYGAFEGVNFPTSGKQKALILLVDYQDIKFTVTDPNDYFSRYCNEPGFSDHGASGSVADFFIENSSGKFMPEFDVYGPVTLMHDRSYYGGHSGSKNDAHPEMMALEAVNNLDPMVDFSQYDRDGDGFIDMAYVIYAGVSEASSGVADAVWPHAWDLASAGAGVHAFDGVRLNRYACGNEWDDGAPNGIGTFVHEFSHVLGLPDLYDTCEAGSFTPGSWSVMDQGSYNNQGHTPPNYSAFERYALGWMDPTDITGPIDAELHPITSNQAYIIRSSDASEYFLFENRQQDSWDRFVPGHGMIVWHIDFNSSAWYYNRANGSPLHQHVDIEEADATQSPSSRDGDSFPGKALVKAINDTTDPSLRLWSGLGVGLPISDIEEKSGIITFKVSGGKEPDEPDSDLRRAKIFTPDEHLRRTTLEN